MLFPLYSVVHFFSYVGGGKDGYTDADINEIRKEWSSFVATCIFR